ALKSRLLKRRDLLIASRIAGGRRAARRIKRGRSGGTLLRAATRNRLGLLFALLAAALAAVPGALPASAEVVATEARLEGDRQETVFSLTMTAGVPAEVFTLANPYRVIIDMPDVIF